MRDGAEGYGFEGNGAECCDVPKGYVAEATATKLAVDIEGEPSPLAGLDLLQLKGKVPYIYRGPFRTQNPKHIPPNSSYENCSHFWDIFGRKNQQNSTNVFKPCSHIQS